MIESLDTVQKEYNKISYGKRSGHGEFFSEYRHPYKCLERFLSPFFRVCVLRKVKRGLQKASTIFIVLKL